MTNQKEQSKSGATGQPPSSNTGAVELEEQDLDNVRGAGFSIRPTAMKIPNLFGGDDDPPPPPPPPPPEKK